MKIQRIFMVAALLSSALPVHAKTAPERFTIAQNLSFPTVDLMTTAPTGSRIAWVLEEKGVRNVWVAEGPSWRPRCVTSFDADDGMQVSQLAFSNDGDQLVFVRNADGGNWPPPDKIHPNPLGLPEPQEVEIWAARFDGGGAHKLASGDAPALRPQGDRLAFVRDGQAFEVSLGSSDVHGSGPAGGERLFFARGTTREMTWSPDGTVLAFVSGRGSHSLLGLFRGKEKPIQWLASSSDHVVSPRWSPDGKQLAFVKLAGSGGKRPAWFDRHPQPFQIWVADADSGEARAVWKSPASIDGSYPDTLGESNLSWGRSASGAVDRLLFTCHLDGWPHLYSVSLRGGAPLLLTPGKFMVEFVSFSPDLRKIVYSGNAGADAADDDRRHLFVVSADRADTQALTQGQGLEWSPAVSGDGASIAFISATTRRPPLPAVMPLKGGEPITLAKDRIPKEFPGEQYVDPRKVVFKSKDGLSIHGQLFAAPVRTGSTRAAVIFVHGGPPRQMLLGFHYMGYYTRDYALNQYLASRGVIVLSVNYRLGIGYGDAFQHPAAAGERGASEYNDVLAAAQYLKSLPDVDPRRIGIYGGSYGGYLTALALARNSDVFAAGVDLHGVHDFTTMLAKEGVDAIGAWNLPERPPDWEQALPVAWRSSPVADVDAWASPALFIHGDDDRNVDISQTVDLVQRLRERHVPFEELMIADETHDWLLFRSWVKVQSATAEFLIRKLNP